MPWRWEELTGKNYRDAAKKLPAEAFGKTKCLANMARVFRTYKIFRHKPSFYKTAELLHVWRQGNYFILCDGNAALLDGKSKAIHAVNNKGELVLETDEQIRDYIFFFCAVLQGKEGQSFRIAESVDSLWLCQCGMNADMREKLAGALHPITVERNSNGAITSRVCMLNKSTLSEALLTLKKDGTIQMEKDAIVMKNVPYRINIAGNIWRDEKTPSYIADIIGSISRNEEEPVPVRKDFAPDQRAEVSKILDTYSGSKMFPWASVCRDVVRKANGDLNKLKELIGVVNKDPRDFYYASPKEAAKWRDEKILHYAADFFKPEELEDVLQILQGYTDKAGDKVMVKTAIIKLSQGDLNLLRHFLDVANKDYRDIFDLAAKIP